MFASAKYNERMIKNALFKWLRACQRMSNQINKAKRDLDKLLARCRIESTR